MKLIEQLKPEINREKTHPSLKWLWSYRFSDFIKLIIFRNRGYITRKILNISFEVLEICFLAYFCHPDFYSVLLFIPFSSFFMNLFIEELFSLNRSSIFDNEKVPSKINTFLISTSFVIFLSCCFYLAKDVITQHWILALIFVLRMTLIAIQAYSFNESLEILIKRRVYFPPHHWIISWLLAFLSIILVSLLLPIELAVGIGISSIYIFRSTIEFKFLEIIKNQKRWFPSNLNTFIQNYSKSLKRFVLFVFQLLTLYACAKKFNLNNQSNFLVIFFILIFCYRILTRPFRALQIDLYRYYTKNALNWVELRIRQLITLNLIFVTTILIWLFFTTSSQSYNYSIPFIFVTSSFYLALSSVGKELSLFHWMLPLKIFQLAALLLIPTDLNNLFFIIGLCIELILYLNVFFNKNTKLIFHLQQPKMKGHLSLNEALINLKKDLGATILVSLSTKSYSLKDEKLIKFKPFRLTPTTWLIPSTNSDQVYELWKAFPRLIRKTKELKAIEVSAYLNSNEPKIEFDINVFPIFSKKTNKWLDSQGQVPSPEMIKEFHQIEIQIQNTQFFSKIKYCYHFNGKFIYPVIELDRLNQIIVIEYYDQKLINFLKAKNWQALKSYFSSSF
jgi:hypothetical protein